MRLQCVHFSREYVVFCVVSAPCQRKLIVFGHRTNETLWVRIKRALLSFPRVDKAGKLQPSASLMSRFHFEPNSPFSMSMILPVGVMHKAFVMSRRWRKILLNINYL